MSARMPINNQAPEAEIKKRCETVGFTPLVFSCIDTDAVWKPAAVNPRREAIFPPNSPTPHISPYPIQPHPPSAPAPSGRQAVVAAALDG